MLLQRHSHYCFQYHGHCGVCGRYGGAQRQVGFVIHRRYSVGGGAANGSEQAGADQRPDYAAAAGSGQRHGPRRALSAGDSEGL